MGSFDRVSGVRALPVLLLAAVAVVAGGGVPAPAQTADQNPLAGLRFYVDQESSSMEQWRSLQRSGQHSKADLVWKIAREPKAVWVGRFTSPNFHVKVRRIFDNAHAQGAVPILTVLRAQSTRCSPTYDGGGPAEDARTRAWYDDLARAIGFDRVLIAFEPDSLGTIDCHARSRRAARYRLLRYGIDALSGNPNATIYIEAGASDWEGASRMAKKLRKVGIAKVRGFMLNATHYDWTRANVAYGVKLSRLVGGKHFVINTAENGRGPVHKRLPNGRRLTVWCNPPKRGLGTAPTTNTSNPMADAYLWINRPGYAQSCQGRPIAWYLPRALSYAKYATSWEAPPPGTKNGFRVR
jgi:endoglucanase